MENNRPIKKLGDKLYNSLFGFNFIEEILGHYNQNFVLERAVSHSQWVGKISKSLHNCGVNFKDLNSRALLAFRLSKLVDAGIPQGKVVPIKRVSFPDNFTVSPEAINKRIFITRFEGENITSFLKSHPIHEVVNLNQMFENFVFNLWVGNYDKKQDDYVINSDRTMFSIDYQLLGPGFRNDNSKALGAFAKPYDFNTPEDTGCCVAPFLIRELQRVGSIDILQPMVRKIEELNKRRIKNSVKGLTFFREGTDEVINDVFINFLIDRTEQLGEKIQDWVKAGYPRKINI